MNCRQGIFRFSSTFVRRNLQNVGVIDVTMSSWAIFRRRICLRFEAASVYRPSKSARRLECRTLRLEPGSRIVSIPRVRVNTAHGSRQDP